MASYPSSVKSFTTKNTGDTIAASHVNDVQDEVAAIEDSLLNGLQHHSKANTNDTYDLGTISVRWRNLYLSGLLSASGLGAHAISGSGTGNQTLTVRNSTAGAANFSAVALTTDVTPQGVLRAHSSTFTTAAPYTASGVTLESAGSGGLTLAATHASGALNLYAAGTTRKAYLTGTIWSGDFTDGEVRFQNATSNIVEAHVRPASGKKGYVSWTEASIADRWALGVENGDGTLYLRQGAASSSTVRMQISSGGIVTAAAQPYCIAYKSGAQEISSNWAAYTAVTWDTEAVDVGGLHDHTTNSQRFTIPSGAGGLYLIVATVLWEADATETGMRGLQIQQDGTTQLASVDAEPAAAAMGMQIVVLAPLTPTQYVQLNVKQDSGGGLDVVGGATFSQFMIAKLW